MAKNARRPARLPRPAVAWWVKCDPTARAHGGWDWPDLFDEYEPGTPYTWSVGTALSQKNARTARPGDPVFGYSAGEGHRVLGALAEVVRGSVYVPGEGPVVRRTAFPGGFTVDLRPVALLDRPVPLRAVREALRGTQPEFFRTRFGSIFKVGPPEFSRLVGLVEATNGRRAVPPSWVRRAGARKHRKG